MIGTYRFYQHGELIAASRNLITTEGAKVILRFLSGAGNSIASSIGVGIGATAATVSDRRLTYELERATVTVASPDFVPQRIIYKGTLSQSLVGKIYEAGIFTSDYNSDSRALVNFDATTESWTGATFNATNARNGADGVRLTPAANATSTVRINNVNLDLSSYSSIDEFLLAYQSVSNIATIRIRFYAENGTSYYEYSFTPSNGYNVKSFTKTNLTKVGTVEYSAISSIEFAATATASAGTLDLDGLRIEDKDFVDPNSVMVSRTVLPTPVVKTNTGPMDIEYALDMTLS